jgi:hypothetical protein
VITTTDKGENSGSGGRFPFGFSVKLLIFVFLAGISASLLWPLQRSIEERMSVARDRIIDQAEAYLQRTIEYGSIGPSLFGILDIRDIRVYGDDSAPVVSAARFRVFYSPWELITGDILNIIRSVRIDRPFLTLDRHRDADLIALFSSWSSGRRLSWEGGLPGELSLRVLDGGGSFTSGENRFALDGIFFDASIRAGRIQIQGKWKGEIDPAGFFDPMTISCRFNGELSADLRQGSLNVSIPSLRGETFRFRPVTVNLTKADTLIELRKINDRSPLDLYLGYDLVSGRLRGEFRTEELVIRDLVSLTGAWDGYNPWLEGNLTGRASLAVDLPEDAPGGVAYEFDLAGRFSPNRPMEGYTLAGRGDGSAVKFDRFFLWFPQGHIRFAGDLGFKPFAPNGYISVSELSLSGEGRVNSEFSVSAENGEIGVFGDSVSLGSVFLSALDLRVRYTGQGLTFSLSALRFRDIESYEDVRLSSISLAGSLDYTRHIQASLEVEFFSVADMVDMARPFIKPPGMMAGGFWGEISLSTEVFFTTNFEHLLYNAPRVIIAHQGPPDIVAVLSLSGTDRRFELNEGRVVWSGKGLEASGYADFSNPQDIAFSLQASYMDLSYFLEGVILDRRSLSVRGSYGLSAYVSMTDAGLYSGYLEAEEIPIPFQGRFARLSLLSSLRYGSSDFWSLDIDRLELLDLATPASPFVSLSITGMADQDGAEFSRLFYEDGLGALSGRALVSWDRDFSLIRGDLTLGGARNSLEQYFFQGAYAGGEGEFRFTGVDVQVGRFMRNSRNALISGEIQGRWNSPASYSAELRLSSLSAQVGERELRGSCRGTLNQEAFTLEDLRVTYGAFQGELPFFRVNLRDARMETESRIWGTLGERPVDLAFGVKLDFEPAVSWFHMARALNTFTGSIRVYTFRLDTVEAPEPFDFLFSRTDSAISLSGGPEDMLRFQMSREGDFYTGLSYPLPVRGTIIGAISPQTIDAQISNLYVDMASLWRYIPRKDIISFSGGVVTASIRISGPLWDPEFFGTAQGTSLRINVPQFLGEDIGPFPGTVVLEGNEMRFGPLTAPVGSGSGLVSGWFRFDRWIPNTFTIDVSVPQDRPIPFAVDIMGIKAGGGAAGQLKLSMEDFILLVSGDLGAENTQITMDAQRLGQPYSYPPSRVSVVTDLTIKTGRKVEFVWPVTLPILQAYVDAGTGVRISSDSSVDRYSIVGDVALRSGEIYYFQRSFYIREGSLSFNENEIRFDPRISARAEIRDRNDEGPVTISMIINNAPLLSFTARFEAEPPLSQAEIFSFLGQNLTGASNEDDSVSNAFVMASSDVLSQFGVFRQGERYIRDFFHLDMFSVRTMVLQNAMLQATGLRNPVDRNGGVGNYFDRTTIFLGKYIRSDMFVQAMVSLRYDADKTTLGGLIIEPDIGIELKNPLFSVRWNFLPLHYENMFMDDMSFTLTWRWSF